MRKSIKGCCKWKSSVKLISLKHRVLRKRCRSRNNGDIEIVFKRLSTVIKVAVRRRRKSYNADCLYKAGNDKSGINNILGRSGTSGVNLSDTHHTFIHTFE